ncbi:hypothetical protein D9M69_569420 [compost metagenome]
MLVEVDVRRHLVDIRHGAIAHAPVGAVLEHLTDHFVGRLGDVHRLGEFDAPVGHLGAVEHLAHDFVGVLQLAHAATEGAQRHLDQVQARRGHRAPLQHAAGQHRHQAAAMADQGQFEILDPLVGGRVGEQLVQRTQRLGGVDLLDTLSEELVRSIAELVALAGRDVQQLAVDGDAVGKEQALVGQQL